ncbi:hypothetical protein [Streptomyces sp. NBC_00094]|uniref:hypothetical protein n=1 Tax=Streptomyces sp. NBC_00094 TaxID=2903620 RepID=UPI00224EA26F|nr:hypothetical protein [Streptomyces sp. NBC_00094]MCX5392189.1 hypothetical protein [Streptomyces sp. NBC_00094]
MAPRLRRVSGRVSGRAPRLVLRRGLLAAVMLPALPLLAGCGVPVAGITGVSVTAEGEPLGVILMCHDRIDSALFYPDEPIGDPDAEVTADAVEPEYTDHWTAAEPVTGFTSWPLTSPEGAGGWTPDAAPRPLEAGRLYTLYGAARDNSWSTGHHSFTLADLAGLAPGQVSYTIGDRVRTTTVEDFRDRACEGF